MRRRCTWAWSLGIAGCSALGGSPEGARLQRLQRSPHWSDGGFRNLVPMHNSVEDGGAPVALWRWIAGDDVREPTEPPGTVRPSAADLATPPAGGLRVTWLGHATALLEVDGRRLLTDPMWSRRASPVPGVGPARFFPPPVDLEDVPPLDAVIISHDHYDHLDEETVRALARRPVPFYVPLGVGAHLERWGVVPERIVELDWWEEAAVGGVRLAAVPARHWSRRGVSDRNRTQWASWVILGPAHRVFFSGDTGMSPTFGEVGRRFGPFDLTLIEIGGYSESWVDSHLGPEQAVAAHQQLRGALMLPIHWGTFSMAFHGWTEPAERVLVAAAAAGVRLALPRPGEAVDLASPPAVARWWPEVPWRTAIEEPIVATGLPAEPQ